MIQTGKIPDKLPQKLDENDLWVEVFASDKLPAEYRDQLIAKSRQPHVMKYEYEDAQSRFKDPESYRKWSDTKKRIIYLLLGKSTESDKGTDVGGIIWFGEKDNPSIKDSRYAITMGIRLYEGYVGKGLSGSFMQATHDDIRRFYPKEYIWLDFDADNIAARRAYESFGYNFLMNHEGRGIMVYPE